MIPKTAAAVVLAALLADAQSPTKACNVSDYGAKGDGNTNDTQSLQKAIDDCTAAGGGTVRLASGSYLSGTLTLKDGINLQIDKGATLLGSRTTTDYPAITGKRKCYRCSEPYSFLFAEGAKNISVTGGGTVDGNDGGVGAPWSGGSDKRPRLVRFMDCQNVVIKNVSFVRSACWTTFLSGCTNVTVDSLTVNSQTGQANEDGIDIDDDHHMTLSHSHFTTGDDAICFKSMSAYDSIEDVTVSDCVVENTHWAAVKLGTESHGGMHGVTIKDCTINFTNSAALCLYSVDGAVVDNVVFDNILIKSSATPIGLRLGSRLRTYPGGPATPTPGALRNITFRNITAVVTANSIGSYFSGIPGYPIENVTLENVVLNYKGSNTNVNSAQAVPPENPAGYPQFDMFGDTLPAYGLYVRHAKGLTFNNAKFSYDAADVRPAVILDTDVTDYKFLAPIQAQSNAKTKPFPMWHKKDGDMLAHVNLRKDFSGGMIKSSGVLGSVKVTSGSGHRTAFRPNDAGPDRTPRILRDGAGRAIIFQSGQSPE